MAGAASLPEPEVLAHAKRRLFPGTDADADAGSGSDTPGGDPTYAVCDTQFATDEWLHGQPIPAEVRATLAPFNHVRVGSGYPDLVGVRTVEPDLLSVARFDDRPPLVAVEAKGHVGAGTVDVERGVVQAYDRLHGVNAAYVAAPATAISGSDRALARELNVGVLGVATDGTVDPLEVPRVVGTRTAADATAIRFQATAQGVANQSLGLNHPKNYLAYPLAAHAPDDTDRLLADHVVRATDDARRGAAFLGLIEERPDRVDLTPLGEEVVRFATHRYGSAAAALPAFDDWKGSRERFADLAPEWGLLTRRVVWAYPATTLLVTELQAMNDDGITAPTLVDLVVWLHEQHPTFAVELFVRGTDEARSRVLADDGTLRTDALDDGAVYHAPTTFQLKATLFHAGILTERGAEPHRLDPTADVWRLRHPVARRP